MGGRGGDGDRGSIDGKSTNNDDTSISRATETSPDVEEVGDIDRGSVFKN